MKRRNWKRIGIISGAIVLVLILLTILVPRLIDLNRYGPLIAQQVENVVGGEVTLGSISWGISNGIYLNINGFSISDASALPGDLELSRIYAHASIPPLLKKKVVLNKVLLDVAAVNVRLGADRKHAPVAPTHADRQPMVSEGAENGEGGGESLNLPRAVDSEEAPSLPFEIEAKQVSINVARFELDDALTIPAKRQVHVYRDIDVRLGHILPGKDLSFDLSMEQDAAADLDEVQIRGTFSGLTDSFKIENPGLRLTAKVVGIELNAVKPYIQNRDIEKQLSGSVSVDLEYEGDLAATHLVAGHIDFGSVIYSNPVLFETSLPGRETSLTFRVKLDPSDAAVEKLEVNFGALVLDARALVRDWAKDPFIQNTEISSNIPLSDVTPLVPWELLGESAAVLRKICEKGGHINLDRVQLPDILLPRLSEDPTALIKDLKLTADYHDITLPLVAMLPDIEADTGRLTLEEGVLSLDDTRTRIGPLLLPMISAWAIDIMEGPKVALTARGTVQVAATGDEKIETILKQYGLKSLAGLAEIDMRADYDHREPDNWTAAGRLALKGLRVEAHPSAVVLDGLQGNVTFSRKQSMDLTFRDIAASINQAPVRLSGEVTAIGTGDMLITADVSGHRLDLGHLGELLPALKDYGLGGTLSMDLEAHVPSETLEKSRINGSVSTRGLNFQLAAYDLAVENGNADLVLDGDAIDIEKLTFHVNDQEILLTGRVSDPENPKAKLLIRSPDLNLDRLLARNSADKVLTEQPSRDSDEQPGESLSAGQKSENTELPPLARKLTADLQIESDIVRYSGTQFENLNVTLLYQEGVADSYDINFNMGEGTVATKGFADLRNLNRIPFTVDSVIGDLQLEKIVPALGGRALPLDGPLSLEGRMEGGLEGMEEVITGLKGRVDAEIGPGTLYQAGRIGNLLGKVLSIASIKGVLSGRTIENLASEGLPFQSLTAQAIFDNGTLNLENLDFKSDTLDAVSKGTIDLVNREMMISADLVPFSVADTALGFIPVAGDTAQSLTQVHLEIEGPLDDPVIKSTQLNRLIEGVVKEPVDILKGVGKGLKKLIPKSEETEPVE
jgi:uncharacterized protein involved in outer membrane biogenesis